MLTKKEFYQLRKEIVLNSLYLNDYKNSFNIKEKSVCDFFESALEYVNETYKETHNADIDIFNVKTSKLYEYYKYLEFDPLQSNDYRGCIAFTAFNGLLFYGFKYGVTDYILVSYYYYDKYGIMVISKPRYYKIYGDYFMYKNQKINIVEFQLVK